MDFTLITIFKEIKDPRIDRNKLYALDEILLVALATIICGGETYVDMNTFGESKLDFFRTMLPFVNGIPSEDTYARVFELLNPKEFNLCFLRWVETLRSEISEIIAVDGKTLKQSASPTCGIKPLHLVSAWATQNRLVLCSQAVDEKSNEITAIPKVLKMLCLKKTTVTLDAMGCQTAIAQQIIDQEGDFVISLKGNQSSLKIDVQLFFELEEKANFKDCNFELTEESIEKGHGRLEKRQYGIYTKIGWLKKIHPRWNMVKGIGFARIQRTIGKKTTIETRFYLTSLKDLSKFAKAVRAHWQIENTLHWVLDVTFGEDDSRIRNKNAAENLALLRRTAVNLFECDTTKKISKRTKRLKAGWDLLYLKSLLTSHF